MTTDPTKSREEAVRYTPLPWKIKSPKHPYSIYSLNGESIATTFLKSRNTENQSSIRDQDNAKFIVKAVNNYGKVQQELDRTKRISEKALGALKVAELAMNDWLHIYAEEFCEGKDVCQSKVRVRKNGTLAYISKVLTVIREATENEQGANEN